MYRILALPTESLRKFCRFISEECSLSSLLLSIRIYRQFDWGGAVSILVLGAARSCHSFCMIQLLWKKKTVVILVKQKVVVDSAKILQTIQILQNPFGS